MIGEDVVVKVVVVLSLVRANRLHIGIRVTSDRSSL
jgi:hypothetical protein